MAKKKNRVRKPAEPKHRRIFETVWKRIEDTCHPRCKLLYTELTHASNSYSFEDIEFGDGKDDVNISMLHRKTGLARETVNAGLKSLSNDAGVIKYYNDKEDGKMIRFRFDFPGAEGVLEVKAKCIVEIPSPDKKEKAKADDEVDTSGSGGGGEVDTSATQKSGEVNASTNEAETSDDEVGTSGLPYSESESESNKNLLSKIDKELRRQICDQLYKYGIKDHGNFAKDEPGWPEFAIEKIDDCLDQKKLYLEDGTWYGQGLVVTKITDMKEFKKAREKKAFEERVVTTTKKYVGRTFYNSRLDLYGEWSPMGHIFYVNSRGDRTCSWIKSLEDYHAWALVEDDECEGSVDAKGVFDNLHKKVE